MAVRTFLAVDLDEAILGRMLKVRQRLSDGASKITWVARENLHVTLNFLGDVPDELLARVCDVASAVAAGVEPFEIEVAGVTATPPRGAPRMFWANVVDASGALAMIQSQLSAGLHGMGLRQEERAFRPHITLARIKYAVSPHRLREAVREIAAESFGTQHVEEIVAYSSQLTSEGPIYTAIARAPLGK